MSVLMRVSPLAVLLAVFLLLGAMYSITTPLFEAGDELWHYPYVQWVARGKGLPVQDPAQKQLWEQEGGQPPLYYVFAALETFWIDTSDLPERLWRNPYAKIGVPLAYGNKNMIVHTSAENFPWQGTTLAVHLIRLLSVLFSAGTVYLTYRVAKDLTQPPSLGIQDSRLAKWGIAATSGEKEYIPLVAAAVVAFNPMFLFISASVNNDSLAALLATAALVVMVRLAQDGASNRRFLILGVLSGFAVLTKVSNLAVVIVDLCVVAWLAGKARDWNVVVRGGALVLIPVGVLAGWWFARNYFLYGDPSAFNVWLKIAGGRAPQTVLGLLDEFQGFRISFWGNFGGVNIIAPEWVYAALDSIAVIAVLGLAIGAWRRDLPTLLWIPALLLLVVFAALIRWTLLTYASQGRLIFNAIAAVGILLAYGLGDAAFYFLRFARRIVPTRISISPLVVPFAVVVFLLVFALAAPFFIIAPVYAQPARLANEANVPNPVHIRYDANGARPELVGVNAARKVYAGKELPITLYWRTDSPIADDLYAYIHIYDSQGVLVGQWNAFPGNGLLPPRVWQAGEIILDNYRVPISIDAAPLAGHIEVGLTRVGSTRPLVARDPAGQKITPTVARFKVSDPHQMASSVPAEWSWDNQLEMLAFDVSEFQFGIPISEPPASVPSPSLRPGDVIQVRYSLRAQIDNLPDYTVFMHLVNAEGKVTAQYDGQPYDGEYPTSLWDAGEVVSDEFAIVIPHDAPAGDYTLEFGIYRNSDNGRLPVSGSALGNVRGAGDHLVIGPLTIAR